MTRAEAHRAAIVVSTALAGAALVIAGVVTSAGAESAAASPAVPSASAGPSAPAASSAAPEGFTTSPPPDPGAAWTGIDWVQVGADDPLAQVRSMVRWHGGFVALGAELRTDDGWQTPVWVSADGATWTTVGPDAFGPSTVIVAVGETPDGLVALTLQSGADQCIGEPESFSCWTLAGPLRAWTSPDATSRTAYPGPSGMALPDPGCDDCGVAAPILAAGTPGLLVVDPSGWSAATGTPMALSHDGIDWQAVPADAIPSDISLGDVAAVGSGFLATGEQAITVHGDETTRAVALTSADGLAWSTRHLPTAGLDARGGSSARQIVSAPDGLIVQGSDGLVPGTELWWSSTRDGKWTRLKGYPPLGVWQGEGEGTGLLPDGTLVGDGERMLAYRAGSKPRGWTSTDGASWQALAITGDGPGDAGGKRLDTLVLTPVGVLATSDDGTTWFGTPRT